MNMPSLAVWIIDLSQQARAARELRLHFTGIGAASRSLGRSLILNGQILFLLNQYQAECGKVGPRMTCPTMAIHSCRRSALPAVKFTGLIQVPGGCRAAPTP